ncbi:hypothetical protein P7C70_g4859, partial [Phenoliferia sp. Uapishka_3]
MGAKPSKVKLENDTELWMLVRISLSLPVPGTYIVKLVSPGDTVFIDFMAGDVMSRTISVHPWNGVATNESSMRLTGSEYPTRTRRSYEEMLDDHAKNDQQGDQVNGGTTGGDLLKAGLEAGQAFFGKPKGTQDKIDQAEAVRRFCLWSLESTCLPVPEVRQRQHIKAGSRQTSLPDFLPPHLVCPPRSPHLTPPFTPLTSTFASAQTAAPLLRYQPSLIWIAYHVRDLNGGSIGATEGVSALGLQAWNEVRRSAGYVKAAQLQAQEGGETVPWGSRGPGAVRVLPWVAKESGEERERELRSVHPLELELLGAPGVPNYRTETLPAYDE